MDVKERPKLPFGLEKTTDILSRPDAIFRLKTHFSRSDNRDVQGPLMPQLHGCKGAA